MQGEITCNNKYFINNLVRYKREMEQIITMQADLDKKLDRQVVQKAPIILLQFLNC